MDRIVELRLLNRPTNIASSDFNERMGDKIELRDSGVVRISRKNGQAVWLSPGMQWVGKGPAPVVKDEPTVETEPEAEEMDPELAELIGD